MRNIRRLRENPPGFLSILGIIGLGIVLCIFVGIGSIGIWGRSPLHRYTAVVIGNPFVVVSWNRSDDSIIAINIPSTVRIEGAYGYGMYSLEALYKLDLMDKRGGKLLLTSLSDAIGYPIDAYLDMSVGKRLFTNDSQSDFHDMWSFSHVVNSILGQRGSFLTPSLIGLVKTAMSIRDEKLQMIDFRAIPGVILQEQLPDQTVADTLDVHRVSEVITGLLEDADIRQERLRVAIFNTTPRQGLGQKAARILSTIGMFIVSVSNDQTERETCLIRTKKEFEQSKTVRVLSYLYHCSLQKTTEPLRSDVDVYIGYNFAKRYEPLHNEK